MVHLFLAAYNAGRPIECLRWAEEAINLGAAGRHLRAAHGVASVACGNLSRLEESENHCLLAHKAAVAHEDKKEIGEALARLADIQHKRGKLTEAYEATRKAETVDPGAVRMAIEVQAEVLRDWGRFNEALELLRRCDDTPRLVIPHHERRMRAVVCLMMARTEAAAGRGDTPWNYLLQAIVEFNSDAKLSLACETTAVWILAVQGRSAMSRVGAEQAEARLADFEQDPSTCRGALSDLGTAPPQSAVTTSKAKITGTITSR